MPKIRIILALLTVSVVLNLALAVQHFKKPASGVQTKTVTYSSGKYQLDGILRNLSDAKRKELRTAMAKDFKQLRAYGAEAGKHRAEAKKMLMEPTVDKAAVNQKFAVVAELNKQSDSLANTMAVEILSALTPAERKAATQRGGAKAKSAKGGKNAKAGKSKGKAKGNPQQK
jgi:uncharacterized membrane protein